MAWIQNPKESTNKFLRLRREIINVRGYKISIQKPIVFPYTNNEHHYTRNENTIPLRITQNNEILKCKSNKTGLL